MTNALPNARLQLLQSQMLTMPPVAAMAISVDRIDEQGLHLLAPLAANVNDKGNAFGGSLASLLTLSSWSWVSLQLEAAGLEADIYVADSQLRYRLPVYEDLHAVANVAAEQDVDAFVAMLRRRGRGRISMQAKIVLASGDVAAEFDGRFAAMLRA